MVLAPAAKGKAARVAADVLGSVNERARRQQIAHAYWRLAQALGEYRLCWEQVEQFQALRVGIVDSSLLQASQETARSALVGAELALVQAQHYLAEAAMLNTDAELPLPSDRPHIGTYTTNFERIFAGQSPPAGTRLIHRTLPLQFQAMGVRLEAIHAAQEALQTVNKAYLAGQVDVGQLFAAMRSVTDQKRAWLASVCQYNHAIAAIMLVVGSETVGRELVSVLIVDRLRSRSDRDRRWGALPKALNRRGTGRLRDSRSARRRQTRGAQTADVGRRWRDERTDAPPSRTPAPKNRRRPELDRERTAGGGDAGSLPAELPPPRRSPLYCMTSPPRLADPHAAARSVVFDSGRPWSGGGADLPSGQRTVYMPPTRSSSALGAYHPRRP